MNIQSRCPLARAYLVLWGRLDKPSAKPAHPQLLCGAHVVMHNNFAGRNTLRNVGKIVEIFHALILRLFCAAFRPGEESDLSADARQAGTVTTGRAAV